MFDNRTVTLMAYPLSTILAEKLETVISRDIGNTRPRDYYDLYTLWYARQSELEPSMIKKALEATARKRNTFANIGNYHNVMQRVSTDTAMLAQWSTYARKYPYVGNLTLQEACKTIEDIMTIIEW